MAPDPNSEDQLARLHSLTDVKLAKLDVDDMLVELLVRVREISAADTAAVLLVDETSHQLIARAACGIEEEVRENVRVPFGTGFAGRIAATKEPVRLDRIDSTTVANPILWEKGIRAMLGVPLLSGDRVIGVLHVGRLDRRPFADHDVVLLQVVAERVAGAIQSRQLAVEQAAARLLERSLLPPSPPACPGVELAVRYAAAAERAVGGDWYDVFTLPSGQLWIVVGDVAGHGLSAAVIMGRIRSALRAYTLLSLPPEEVLELVDRKVTHFEIRTFATVICAVADPPYDSLTIATAGHPPPVVVGPDGAAVLVDMPVAPPVGIGRGPVPQATTVPFPPESLIVLYTDGLVERRRESIDEGLERLRAAVQSGPAETVARDVMHRLLADVVPFDDVALVVARRLRTP